MACDREMFMAERKYKMLRGFVILNLAVLLLQAGPGLANDDLSSILDRIQEKYGRLPGLSMTYTREVITRTMSMLGNQVKGDLAEGQIFFKPPYFLRLEQKRPKRETLIADGETLWWYIHDKRLAHKYPFEEFGKELKLLSDIFRGLSEMEKSFQVTVLEHRERSAYEIELRPDPTWQEIDRIVLTVTCESDIQVVDIHNQLGGITRFRLYGLTSKENFEKGFFQFHLPEGVELVEEEG